MADWVVACRTDDVDEEDVIPVEHNGCPYAVYHSPDGQFYASDGVCTHEHTLLADGLVMGHIIECPKHNGRFDYRTGEGKGAPITENLRTYPVKVEDGTVLIDLG
jgi:3-phenylpropionate/trans-cinnamate dioxygenase ferredoxin subunit